MHCSYRHLLTKPVHFLLTTRAPFDWMINFKQLSVFWSSGGMPVEVGGDVGGARGGACSFFVEFMLICQEKTQSVCPGSDIEVWSKQKAAEQLRACVRAYMCACVCWSYDKWQGKLNPCIVTR